MDFVSPIKVLQITSNSEGFYGIERVIMTLAKYLDRRSFDIQIACIERKRISNAAIMPAARSAGLKAVQVSCHGHFDWDTVKELKSLVQTRGIDILHCHESKSRLYGVLVSRLTGVPIMATQHGLTPHDLVSRIANLVDIGSQRFCDKVITVANRRAKSMGCALIPSNRIHEIPNGIDLDEFSGLREDPALRTSLGIPALIPVIGTVGRLSTEKGQDILITAARQLTDMGQEAAYLIVGEGPDMNKLQIMSHNLGLANRIVFAGFQKDIRPFLATMAVFVLPSRTEGTPMALLEAMAMGKPVVVTPVGGVPDIVSNGVNGIILRERSATQLTQALLTLLTDDSIATRLAEHGRRRVESAYSGRRMAERYESAYRECLASRLRRAATFNNLFQLR